eukprot:TRINITY_DN15141_c0_g4_i1.p1 TRINITY_DN15141_c0_g4~~TRINITY_DN15141_c0_g4_i1.p1  ORF type:complete len:534 (-),score=39.37 TRINITY_DN15141_c0_g4_i1:229-1650(-)
MFFHAASARFGEHVEKSNPQMIRKILSDFSMLDVLGNVIEPLKSTRLEELMQTAADLSDLKEGIKKAFVENEYAYAPVISMLDTVVRERWLERFGDPIDNFDVTTCLNNTRKLRNHVANCYAAEFANGVLMMQVVNTAMMLPDVAEQMRKSYADIFSRRFNTSSEDWEGRGAVKLYEHVQRRLRLVNKERYANSQFKALKLTSIMMPFESALYIVGNDDVFQKPLPTPKPRWAPTYEDFRRASQGQSHWETMQVNIAEANLGDITKGWGNNIASQVLIQFLKQHSRTVRLHREKDHLVMSFPPQWIGLYTLWNHLFVMSVEARPISAAILYFPLILENLGAWPQIRTNSLWLFIHEASMTNRGQSYAIPREVGKAIGKITKAYARLMTTTYGLKKVRTPPMMKWPAIARKCIKFFFTTFGEATGRRPHVTRALAKSFLTQKFLKSEPTAVLQVGENATLDDEGAVSTAAELLR